jgi:simple sugar transport system ATP-binding protein
MRDIRKSFGPVEANRGAALEVTRGEIHALVGENGAGKSTLMRILSGMYAPDAGHVEVEGRDVTGWHTSQAIAAGVGMVHQHFMLVPPLSVAENVMLGREFTRGAGVLDVARAEREVGALSERTGLRVEPSAPLGTLSVGQAQRVEILKVLFRGARILILDEPTAVLSPPEVVELWAVLRRLREDGGTIVLITHKLDEVMQISDVVTVMRHGRTVQRMRTRETTPREIAKAMVGRDVALVSEAFGGLAVAEGVAEAGASRGGPPTGKLPATSPTTGTTPSLGASTPRAGGLRVEGLTVRTAAGQAAVEALSLAAAPGEILGIAGVEGNGQRELIEAIAGLRAVSAGRILLDDTDITRLSVRERGDAGLSHIPEDRHERGLILDYSIADNLILGMQHHFARRGALDRARIARNAADQIETFDIRPADPALPARALSGGNQQKIVIAREMGRAFRALLAAQPTRGVDVGAIEFIHRRLREARDAGKAILLVSADLAEVLALSDRIAVMYEGRVAVTLPRAAASEEVLGPYMTGAAGEAVA